jgi:glycosyltransferase involved in cell wall biosynthesis
MKPKVTIGICVKNGAATLAEAVDSVLAQDFSHELTELIFVDDGSTDNSLRIMKSYAGKNGTSTRLFTQEWRGLGASRQLVVDQAKGEYIVWVDCDMVLPKDHVRKQVEFMDANPRVGLAKARYETVKSESVPAALENLPFVLADSNDVPLDLKLPGTGGAIFRVNAVKQVGGFDVNLKGVGEDQDIAYRVKHCGWLIKRSSAIFHEKRVGTWNGLWKKWLWYGHGDYHLYLKNRNIFSLFRMNALAGLVNGFLQIPDAYRKIHKSYVLLMPYHLAFTMTAWCIGFSNEKWLFHPH